MPWDLWRIHIIHISGSVPGFAEEPAAIGLKFPNVWELWKGRMKFAWRLLRHHRRDDWRAVLVGVD